MAAIIVIAPEASTLCMFHFNGILVGEIEWFLEAGRVCVACIAERKRFHIIFFGAGRLFISLAVYIHFKLNTYNYTSSGAYISRARAFPSGS